MQIDIQARNFPLTDALRSHVVRRLGFALSTRDDHIQHVKVRLYELNGPSGRANKCCHIMVVLAHLPDVMIEDIQADLYVAIDRAADRVSRIVGRQFAPHRNKGHSSGLIDTVSIAEASQLLS